RRNPRPIPAGTLGPMTTEPPGQPRAGAIASPGSVSPIGVVIPAYNSVRTLGAALASVAAQTLTPATVVVGDDHSDDDTAALARRWQGLLPVEVVRLERNSGPAAARRTAIARIDAPLIALLDADDVWLPDHLASLAALHARAGGIVCADALRWHPGEGVREATQRANFPIPPPDHQLLDILRHNFVSIGALFPRAAYEDVGGFRDGVSGAEDWDLWIRLIRAGLRVHGVAAPTLLYRVESSGLSHRTDIFDTYARVLERAVKEAGDGRQRAVAQEALGWMRKRRALAAAYTHARAGRPWQARGAALACLPGSPRFSLEAGLILASPSLAIRIGDALRRRRW
ncbi:MAG TPA: glycosyltransferase family A protein, partial [Candidatus Saccharimonadales bacterium]|nr:glycosyltransferase family A protein [Candidatus Saccharimonadales bacterium]